MAALRKLSKGFIFSSHLQKPNSTNLLSSPVLPALLISCRGIASKLFVGGLSFYTNEQGLSEAFSQYGQVIEAKVVMDRVSDRSKGFGFVTYASEDEADKAIAEMDGKVSCFHYFFRFHLRRLKFNPTVPCFRDLMDALFLWTMQSHRGFLEVPRQ
ncbi:hypothetical protein ACS0TY_016062 [Phlomoides rotata]